MAAGAPTHTRLILAIDAGTTSVRAIVFSETGEIVSTCAAALTQICPAAARVEHDADELWSKTQQVIYDALARVDGGVKRVAAVGVTNQRETVLAWRADTGTPYHNALVWQDQRGEPLCEVLSSQLGGRDALKGKTGLPLVSYFSATKLRWLLDNVPGLREDAEAGRALAGTVDAFLLWRLTGGAVHATDVSNASRTLLMNIHTLTWDDQLCALFRVPRRMLPSIHPSSCIFGHCATDGPLPGVPIAGVLGDQQSALFGQACFAPGDAKNTYGTGCFLLMNTGSTPVESTHGLVTTVAYQLGAGSRPVYALEGSVAVAGAVVNWMRDNVGLVASSAETEAIARSVPDNGGVMFVPAFNGLFAPHWRSDARGLIIGLSGHTTKAHVVRAALEGVAFQSKELLGAMMKDARHLLPKDTLRHSPLRVDGGMTANTLLLQFQADIMQRPVVRPVIAETTALGAAYAAGLAVGVWSSTDDLARQWKAERTYEPALSSTAVRMLSHHWDAAVRRTLNWASVLAAHVGEDGHVADATSSESARDKVHTRRETVSWKRHVATAVACAAAGVIAGIAIARVAARLAGASRRRR